MSRLVSHLVAAGLGVAVGWYAAHLPKDRQDPPGERAVEAAVTGIGGVFFKTPDPVSLVAWYQDHLGIEPSEWGGHAFLWREHASPHEIGYTIWSAFPDSTDYFSSADQQFMVNFRVADLPTLVTRLRAEGVEILAGIEEYPNGRFAWVLDPDGRKVELWEPVPSAVDPYLSGDVSDSGS